MPRKGTGVSGVHLGPLGSFPVDHGLSLSKPLSVTCVVMAARPLRLPLTCSPLGRARRSEKQAEGTAAPPEASPPPCVSAPVAQREL